MALITISGDAGCRTGELARAAAGRLDFEVMDAARLESLMIAEFGSGVPARAWAAAATSIVARLAAESHLVVETADAERLLPALNAVLRVRLEAADADRIGMLMVDRKLDRAAAKALLIEMDAAAKARRRERFGARAGAAVSDVVLNAASVDAERGAAVVAAAMGQMMAHGVLTEAAEAQVQFQARLQLAKFGIAPVEKPIAARRVFSHPSEALFAKLLDFYRIPWEYEPRSFPLQWDKDGHVTEAFTPDFYLREFDLYVELTTMKQALVTRKNRKVKLLKAIYPHVNIQVFYQKDFQDLIFKYGLEGKPEPGARNGTARGD